MPPQPTTEEIVEELAAFFMGVKNVDKSKEKKAEGIDLAFVTALAMDPRRALTTARNIGEVNQAKKMIAELDQVSIHFHPPSKLKPIIKYLLSTKAKKEAAKESEPVRLWIDLCDDDKLPDIPNLITIPAPSWNSQSHGHLHKGRPLYTHTYIQELVKVWPSQENH